jgi:hypothetical protein
MIFRAAVSKAISQNVGIGQGAGVLLYGFGVPARAAVTLLLVRLDVFPQAAHVTSQAQ